MPDIGLDLPLEADKKYYGGRLFLQCPKTWTSRGNSLSVVEMNLDEFLGIASDYGFSRDNPISINFLV
jgi:hypothetical protein